MSGNLEIVRPGAAPPCQKAGAAICRGCSGWAAMLAATLPGGAWQGLIINCTATGLAVRGAGAQTPK